MLLNGSQQGTPPDRPESLLNPILLIVRAWATSLEVFLHEFFGIGYLGLQAAAVVLLVPIYACFWGGHDAHPLFWFLGIYLLLCGLQRIDSLSSRGRQRRSHSRYTGSPFISRILPGIPELTIKKAVEPLLAIFVGLLLCGWNRPLGLYVFIGGVCLMITVTLDETLTRARAQELHDAVIDQQLIAERFRQLRGDHF